MNNIGGSYMLIISITYAKHDKLIIVNYDIYKS